MIKPAGLLWRGRVKGRLSFLGPSIRRNAATLDPGAENVGGPQRRLGLSGLRGLPRGGDGGRTQPQLRGDPWAPKFAAIRPAAL